MMLKTRTISGFDAFTKLAEYDDQSNDHKSSGRTDKSYLANVVFGSKRPRQTRRIRRNENDEPDTVAVRSEQIVDNPYQIVQKDIIDAKIRAERELYVPKSIQDNAKVPWELVVMSMVDESIDTSISTGTDPGTNSSRPIDDFLNSIDFSNPNVENLDQESKDNSSDEASEDHFLHIPSSPDTPVSIGQIVESPDTNIDTVLAAHDSNLKGSKKDKDKKKFLQKTDKLMPSRLQYHNTGLFSWADMSWIRRRGLYTDPLDIDASKYQTNEGVIKKISNTMNLMIVNTVLEKLIKRSNHEVKKMDGIDPKSFWMTDESSMYALSEVLFFSNPVRSETKVDVVGQSAKRSIEREFHKRQMLDYVKHILSDDNMCTGQQMKKFFSAITNIHKIPNFDEYGVTHALKNHPFVFYCVVDGRSQLYKLVVTDINYPTKINYKLYQIDTLPKNGSGDEFVTRPLIISRDVTDKFTDTKGGLPVDSNKFTIQKNFVKLEVNESELTSKDVILLHRLNDYATYWASFMNNIMNDATRCIRAYVRNAKKTKIQFDPSPSIKQIRSVLSEIHKPELLVSDVKQEAQNRNNAMKVLLDTGILTQRLTHSLTHERSGSLMFRMFHPFSQLIREVSKKQIVDKDKFNELKDQISKQSTTGSADLYDRLISNVVLTKKEKYHVYLRDMVFMNDGNNVYHYVTDLNTMGNKLFTNTKNIICDLSFSSNCIIKIYLRMNDVCMLIGEGNTVKFPMIYEHIVHNMFIKIEADPDRIMERLKKNNVPPYIQISGTWMKTNMSEKTSVFDVGCVIDCLSNSGTSEEKLASYVKVNFEVDDKRYLYFGQIKNSEHMQQIESMVRLHRYVYLSGSSELNEIIGIDTNESAQVS